MLSLSDGARDIQARCRACGRFVTVPWQWADALEDGRLTRGWCAVRGMRVQDWLKARGLTERRPE